MGEHAAHLRAIYGKCYPAGVVHGGPGQVELPVDGGHDRADLTFGVRVIQAEFAKLRAAGVHSGFQGAVREVQGVREVHKFEV